MTDLLLIDDDDLVIVSDEPNEIIVLIEDSVIEIVTVGEVGPPGPQGAAGSGSGGVVLEFTFGDATPRLITTVAANKTIFRAFLNIEVPFNGTSPSLKIGSTATPDDVMLESENDPTIQASFETHPSRVYGSSTQVFLTIVPGGGTTQGRGQVILDIEP